MSTFKVPVAIIEEMPEGAWLFVRKYAPIGTTRKNFVKLSERARSRALKEGFAAMAEYHDRAEEQYEEDGEQIFSLKAFARTLVDDKIEADLKKSDGTILRDVGIPETPEQRENRHTKVEEDALMPAVRSLYFLGRYHSWESVPKAVADAFRGVVRTAHSTYGNLVRRVDREQVADQAKFFNDMCDAFVLKFGPDGPH